MKFSEIKQYKMMIFLALGFLVFAGSLIFFNVYLQPEEFQKPLPDPRSPLDQTGPVPVVDSGSRCSPQDGGPRVPVPVDTSVPIRDPMPGIRYTLNESDSGRNIVLEVGEVFEINLRWNPGLGFHWVIPVTGCGLEMMNAGTYSGGGDFWNKTGHYRARYRAVSAGTSVLDGRFILTDVAREGDLQFNLTVIVK
jgi:predicted secreted protein